MKKLIGIFVMGIVVLASQTVVADEQQERIEQHYRGYQDGEMGNPQDRPWSPTGDPTSLRNSQNQWDYQQGYEEGDRNRQRIDEQTGGQMDERE